LSPIPAVAAGNSVDPSTYVHSVCTTLTSYTNQVKTLQASSNISSATSLTDVRDGLVAFLDQVVAASNSALTDLQKSGAPNLKNGNKIAALIVNEITALRDAFKKAASDSQALNISDPKAFTKGLQAIKKRIDVAGTKSNRVLDDAKKRYKSKTLNAAVSRDPSCQGLHS
jgi:hypothetical protein